MGFDARTPFEWKLRRRTLALGRRTRVMGILNVTPDSFSDGRRHLAVEGAVDRGLALLDAGADILDVGGESTRPGAVPVTAEEERARVLPVLLAVLRARPEAVVSIDTYHAETARLAVEAGAEIVNDVSGMTWNAAMPGVCAALGCGVVLTHARGRPEEWAKLPALPAVAVMPVVLTGLRDALLGARRAGVPSDRIVLDPGFGFGKRGGENYTIHALLGQLRQFGLPVLTGSSRKGFLRRSVAAVTGGVVPEADSAASLHASLASEAAAILAGAHVVRVHDVRAAVAAAAVADAVLAALHPTLDDETAKDGAPGSSGGGPGFTWNASTVPQ